MTNITRINDFFTEGDITYLKLIGDHAEKDNIHTIIDTKFLPIILDYQWYYGKNGYAINYKMINFPLHQMIFNLHLGEKQPEGFYIDHINRDKLDNRIANLRLATPQENSFNRTISGNSTLPRGVKINKNNKYSVSLTKDGKKFKVKDINTSEEAAIIYNEIARELFGEFAVLNREKLK